MCFLGRRLHTSEAVYKLLTRLGSDTIEKFHVLKLLKSTQADVTYLFLLWRLSHHLGEAFRTRSQSQLRLILQFKGTGPPPPNVPMRLQILSDSMCDQIKHWLLGFTFHHAVNFHPFHKVRAPFVRVRNRTLGQLFFTFRSTLTWWTPAHEPQCQCHLFPAVSQQRSRKMEHISAFAHECYRLVLEVRLFPSPPALFLSVGPSLVSAFFFLLPFRVYPASAVCVCVRVTSEQM